MSSSQSDVCGGSSRDGVGAGSVNSGDWICGDVTCRHSNFARRQKCNKCQRDRSLERSSSVGSGGSNKKKLGTEIGKAAAEKSRGLFSAEDWQCNKCTNVNWARRMTCNMCNAPKFCDVEERTGFGGGYNDRGIVEYKDREESDSEYDEFGRLKKRSKNCYSDENKTKTNSKEKPVLEQDDECEEDEEEDGSDDDLAKYNLFSDDEEVLPSTKSNNSKPSNDSTINTLTKSLNEKNKSPLNRRSRSRTRSNIRRRASYSSSKSSSSSSSSTSSSSSSTSSSSSSSSASTSSKHSKSLEKSSHLMTGSCSRSRSRVRSSPHQKAKHPYGYSSKSRSKSRSSHQSSRSPTIKRNRNSSSSRKHSRSPRSHRKRLTRSRSMTPKRRR